MTQRLKLALALAAALAAPVAPAAAQDAAAAGADGAPYSEAEVEAYEARLAERNRGNSLIRADRLLDVRTGRWLENVEILVSNGRIEKIAHGAPGLKMVTTDTKVIDLTGMSLVPGLIDMHVHLDSDPSYGGYTGLQFSDRFWSVLQVKHAAKTLEAGFTTVRNVGSDAFNDVGLRQAIDEGKIPGPRVVTAAYSFGATGGHCDSTYFPPSFDSKSPYNADSPEEGRKRVRELRKYGAQVIKICATGGVFSRNTEPGQQQLAEAEMRAIVDEAHQWGLKVAAHAHGASGIAAALRAGVDTIEHASLIDDAGIALAKKSDAWLSMDIYNTDYTQAEGAKNGVLPDNLRKDREIAEVQRQGFRRAARRRRAHGLRHRRGRLSARPERPTVRGDGALWHDAAAGHPVGDGERVAGPGPRRRRRGRSGPLGRPGGGEGRPHRRRRAAGAHPGGDQGRRRGQGRPLRRWPGASGLKALLQRERLA